MNKNLALSIPTTWEYVRQLRRAVDETLADYSEDLRKEATMTSSELVENAIKYGVPVPALKSVTFNLKTFETGIQIAVANGATDLHNIAELEQRLTQIKQAADKEELYLLRLHQILRDPTARNKLGLYRIAFEGQFDLDCHYAAQVLTVTATKSCL
jgi:hypothetical protein